MRVGLYLLVSEVAVCMPKLSKALGIYFYHNGGRLLTSVYLAITELWCTGSSSKCAQCLTLCVCASDFRGAQCLTLCV